MADTALRRHGGTWRVGIAAALLMMPVAVPAVLDEAAVGEHVVAVRVYKDDQLVAEAAGVVVNDQGDVLTSAAVVDAGPRVSVVTLNSTELFAEQRWKGKDWGLAVLRAEGLPGPGLPVSTVEVLRGATVFAVTPAPGSGSAVFSRGAVAGLTTHTFGGDEPRYVQHITELTESGYGSPVVNECGEVIGINVPAPDDISIFGVPRKIKPKEMVYALGAGEIITRLRAQGIDFVTVGDVCKTAAERAEEEKQKAEEEKQKAEEEAQEAQQQAEEALAREEEAKKQAEAAKKARERAELRRQEAQENAEREQGEKEQADRIAAEERGALREAEARCSVGRSGRGGTAAAGGVVLGPVGTAQAARAPLGAGARGVGRAGSAASAAAGCGSARACSVRLRADRRGRFRHSARAEPASRCARSSGRGGGRARSGEIESCDGAVERVSRACPDVRVARESARGGRGIDQRHVPQRKEARGGSGCAGEGRRRTGARLHHVAGRAEALSRMCRMWPPVGARSRAVEPDLTVAVALSQGGADGRRS